MNEKQIEITLNTIAAITMILIFILLFLAVLALIQKNTSTLTFLTIGILTSVGGFSLFAIEHKKIFSHFYDNAFSKIAMGFITYAVATISVIYANQFIAQKTGINPDGFQNSRNLLAVLIAPLLWTLVFYFFALFIYIIQAVRFSGNTFEKTRHQILFRNAVSFLGLLIWLVLIAPGLLNLYSTKFIDDSLTRMLILSSFLENKNICTNLTPDQKLAFLNDDSILVATYDNNIGWHFTKSKCHDRF